VLASACLIQPALAQAPALSPEAAALLDSASKKAEGYQQAMQDHRKAGKDPKTFEGSLSKEIAEYGQRLQTEKDPQIRQALLLGRMTMGMLSGVRLEPGSGKLLLVEVSPAFSGWRIWPQLMFILWDGMKDETAAKVYFQEALEKNPAKEVQVAVLGNQAGTALYEGDEAAFQPLLARLEKDFPDSRELKNLRREYQDYLKTKPGNPAPALSIPSLEDPKTTLTLGSLKGKYVLVDFWATWCGPCKGELPHLHKAWERFKGRNFAILSISSDRKPEDVAAFRKDPATPMPWLHGFHADPAARKALGEAYGVYGIPKPILIGPDGRVVTLAGLRGDDLEKTLAKYLGQ
jgi:thiol-disulfide isomerase/thioredoxin